VQHDAYLGAPLRCVKGKCCAAQDKVRTLILGLSG
jgi:hypothetical protein